MGSELISGYAAVFHRETVIAGEFRERISPKAFERTLREKPDVLALLDHDSGRVLGRVSARTLKLRTDLVGLHFSLDVDETTPEGQTALGTVKRQDTKGCSFGFRVRGETWIEGDSRLPLRVIDDLDLFEITLTAFPAYEGTSAAIVQNDGAHARRRIQASRSRAEAAMRQRGIWR